MDASLIPLFRKRGLRHYPKEYAGGGKEIKPHRPGFKELEFLEGNWSYRDSYAGFYSAPGQEVVRYKGKPVWAMAYSGGMVKGYHGNLNLALKAFDFLKDALKLVSISKPFRGPEKFKKGDFEYISSIEGDIGCFSGTETIRYRDKVVFKQDYVGGLIVDK